MLQRNIIIMALLCLISNAFGQSSTSLKEDNSSENGLNQTVRGRVLDQDTQMPIFGATVIIVGSDPLMGATTDYDGYYRIKNVPVGRITLKYSYLGYEESYMPNMLLGTGKELLLNVNLVESAIKMDEIVVTAESAGSQPINEMAMISGRSFTVEETKRYPISIGDPMRLASAFAGVMGTDDESNEIIVRGNSPRGILWKMEGVEIPNPNHFSSEGASSGGISMFSTQVISRSDFYTGAFAPTYGNALSGVFDINLRNGNDEKHEHTIQAGLLGLDLASEGPINKGNRSSYLFNYRYSTLAMLKKVGVDLGGDGETQVFQDLSFKVNLPTENFGTFSFFGMGGISEYTGDFPGQEKLKETYRMGVTGISNQYIINDNTFIKTTLSASGTEIIDNEDYFGEHARSARRNYEKSFLRANVFLNKKLNAKNLLEIGGTYSHLGYTFNEKYDIPFNMPPYNEYEPFNESDNSATQQAYASWKYRFTNDLSLVTGLHYFRFDFTGEQSVEPRSSLKWQFAPNQSFSAGFGVHSRMESLEYYLAKSYSDDGSAVQKNRNLGFSKALHYVVGYDRVITPSLYFKAEIYYQHLYHVPVVNEPGLEWQSTINFSDGYTSRQLVNEGTGTNYGLELTLDKKFSNQYYFLINASLFESKYKAMDGIERNTKFNGNQSYHAMAGKEWKVGKSGKNNIFGVSFKGSYSLNQRYIGYDFQQSRIENREILDLGQIYTNHLPAYFRMDIQISFRKNKAKTTSELRLDIQNVTGRQNVKDYYYSGGEGYNAEEQLGLIPILSYKLEF